MHMFCADVKKKKKKALLMWIFLEKQFCSSAVMFLSRSVSWENFFQAYAQLVPLLVYGLLSHETDRMTVRTGKYFLLKRET